MSYKDTGINNPGTSIKYGADDLEMVMRMFNGVTTGVGGPRIKTVDKWGFWDNIMFIRNQADTKSTFIRGQSNSPSTDVTLALPPITTNDTLSALGITNVFSTKQEFDDGVLLKQQSAPPNPAATFNHFYAGTNGHLIRRDSTGAEFDYDVAQNGLPAGLDTEIQFNNNGVFDADAALFWNNNELNTKGLVVSEDLLLTGDITPPQITTDQNNYSPTGWGNATTLRLSSDAARNITGIGNQGDGTILFIHNVGSFNITLKDESTSSTAENRFAFPSDVVLSPDNTATIKYDSTTGRWRLVSVGTLASGFALLNGGNVFTGGTQKVEGSGSDLVTMYRAINTSGLGPNIKFHANDSVDNEKEYARLRAEIAVNTVGAEYGRMFIQLTQNGATQQKVAEFREDGTFRCGSANRRVIISDSGLTAQNTYTFPDITTKLAGLAAQNIFTDFISISKDVTDLLYLKRPVNTVNSAIDLNYNFNNSVGTDTTFVDTRATLVTNTAGAEDGRFAWSIMRAGTKQTVMQLENNGVLKLGRDGSNLRTVPSIIYNTTDDQDFSNTSAEQTILSFTVKGGVITADGHLMLTASGNLTQNQATATTYTVRVKVGGTTIYQDNFGGSIGQSSTSRPWYFELMFYPSNQSSTTARMGGFFMMNDTSGPTTGQGSITDDETQANACVRAIGISWTFANDTTVAVTVQMSVADANTDFHISEYNAMLLQG